MTTEQYWSTVSAAFVGCAFVVMILAGIGLLAQLVMNKRAQRAETDEHETNAERVVREADEPLDEGKLRVAVRRSHEIPFHDPNDAPEPGSSRHSLSGNELFDADRAARLRQEQADAAAVRRGEETRPIATVRKEMQRIMLCEPPMIDGETLFAYLKHHAPQPSGLGWDAENMGALATVTEALYNGCLRDPLVRGVFDGYDLDELRRHFVRALMVLAKDGLDVTTADALGRAHAHLNIRPEQFDAVTGHLVQALKAALQPRVFESVVHQLSPAVAALRVRIVAR